MLKPEQSSLDAPFLEQPRSRRMSTTLEQLDASVTSIGPSQKNLHEKTMHVDMPSTKVSTRTAHSFFKNSGVLSGKNSVIKVMDESPRRMNETSNDMLPSLTVKVRIHILYVIAFLEITMRIFEFKFIFFIFLNIRLYFV